MRSSPACHVFEPMSASWNERPVGRVEAPAYEGAADPLLQPEQVVVAEAEPAADRLASGEVEDFGRGDPRGGQLEYLGDHAHDRVGLPERPVGQTDLEGARRVSRPFGDIVAAERRLDQRREVLDVGAHDDDVARLQRGIRVEQVQDRVAQHFDLAAPAVAGVHRDAVVVGSKRARVSSSGPLPTPGGARSRRTSSWIRRSTVEPDSAVGGDAASP